MLDGTVEMDETYVGGKGAREPEAAGIHDNNKEIVNRHSATRRRDCDSFMPAMQDRERWHSTSGKMSVRMWM